MARITHVKSAQQRYERVPVIDPSTGKQKETPKIGKSGKQATTKHGALVNMKITAADKSKPLPMPVCEACGVTIEVGQPYKHVSPKSGPYGGRTRVRCAACPAWQPWDLSNSLSSRMAQVAHEFEEATANADSADTITDALSAAAESIREIAEEKREGASNIEEGFGHPTSQSEELESIADDLDSWADEVEQAEVPDYPEPEEDDCEECDGSGEVIDTDSIEEAETTDSTPKVTCEICGGSGRFTPEEPTEEQVEDWLSEVESNVSIINECPV